MDVGRSFAQTRISERNVSILWIGAAGGTSLHRVNALRRLGHRVELVDLRTLLPRTPWIDRVTWRLGGNVLSPLVMRKLPQRLGRGKYDLCCVDGGDWVTPRIIELLREHAQVIVNYNIDDPLGMRDGRRSVAYRQSLHYYDLCVVVRAENVAEAMALGARRVLRVYRAADEAAHAPRPLASGDEERWRADVLFIGTWFPERGPVFAELLARGVPLTIRGARWQKAPEWSQLKSAWKGGELFGDDYAKAIQCAKVNLGLVSKGNRDQHTTRSLEIPALGGLLCAERTDEHLEMYDEGTEALFWRDAAECADMCAYALADEDRRRRIAAAGHARMAASRNYNEPIMQTIVDAAVRMT